MKTLLLLLLPTLLLAQDKDLIISKSSDTISCTISKVSKSSLYYTQNNGNTKILALNKISTYYLDGTKKESGGIIADCEYTKNEVDKFTKIRMVITKSITLSSKILSVIACQSMIIGEYKLLQISIVSASANSIDKDSDFMVMDNKDSIITIKALDYSSGKYLSGGSWLLQGKYIVNDAQIEHFIHNRISSIRIYSNDGYIEREIKEKNAIQFQGLLRCIQ